MITSNIGEFPLYIVFENDEASITKFDDFDIDPFCYQLKLNTEDHTGYALCENIPCQSCILSETCKSGENATRSIIDFIKESNPELLI